MDSELKQFQEDLLDSVRQMKADKAALKTEVSVTAIIEARTRAKLTQVQFAELLGVSKRTLEGWEQGRRTPSKAAMTLIKIAEKHPDVLREVAETP